MAAVGSSIGLGNIWKFPYEMGQYGGGTFLIVYLPCVFLLALPIMMAELMIGRLGGHNPIHGIREVAKRRNASSAWQIIGWLCLLTALLIFSYYSVVASWILFYIMKSLLGSFVSVPAEIVQNSWLALLHNSDQMLLWHSVFVLALVLVLARDLRAGLERAVRWLMPCFIVLLVWLLSFAMQVGDIEAALAFMLNYDLEAIDSRLILSAMSQALFSLSIGMGVLIMYGAYLGPRRPILIGAGVLAITDTVVAILMAAIIFSIVFAFGMRPDTGYGLIFETLPVAFSQMPNNGLFWSSVFFIFLLLAALTSAFALLDPLITWMTEQWLVSRRVAAWLVGALAWISGCLSVYSFSDLAFGFYHFSEIYKHGFFDFFNVVTTTVLLPLLALLISVFTGWSVLRTESKTALALRFRMTYKIWRISVKLVVPIILIALLFTSLRNF